MNALNLLGNWAFDFFGVNEITSITASINNLPNALWDSRKTTAFITMIPPLIGASAQD